MAPGLRSNCTRCGTVLRITRVDPLNRHLALTFAAMVLFTVVWMAMLMKVSAVGIVRETFLESGPRELVARGLWPLAIAVAFTTAYAPLGKFLATFYVLIGLKMRRPPPRIRDIFLLSRRLNTWCMLEVLLLGVFVAYTKLGDLVTIELGPAVYALGVLTVVWVWAEVAFDPHVVWEEIERRGLTHAPMPVDPPLAWRPGAMGCEGCGLVSVPAETDGHCPRCGSLVHERKPNSVSRTWALVLAAVVLYIPANVYPVLTVMQLGAGEPSTILGGVEELLDSGMYPLAALVFFASIMVPLFKLLGLGSMLTATQLGRPGAGASVLIRERTALYHIVAWIGRWSMVDIFMESLLGALVQFGRAVTIEPGVGALAFCAVVFITIFAAETFDPRLMWDAAGRNPHRAPAARPDAAALAPSPSAS
jgi:paraquat-inducible protein A